MNINVELGNGMTIQVPADKYYNCTDEELQEFIEYNIIYSEHNKFITDPFDSSAIETFQEGTDDEDTSIDFNPEDWD